MIWFFSSWDILVSSADKSYLMIKVFYHIKNLLESQSKLGHKCLRLLCHGSLQLVIVETEVVEESPLMRSPAYNYNEAVT